MSGATSLIAALLLLAPTAGVSQARPPAASPSAAPDTLRADSLALPSTVMLDSGRGDMLRFPVSEIEVGVVDGRPTVSFEKIPGRFTAELMQWSAMATRLPGAAIELRNGLATPLTLHLTGVMITSARVIAAPKPTVFGESRLALEESLAQLGSDAQDADRELSALEALGRKKMAAGPAHRSGARHAELRGNGRGAGGHRETGCRGACRRMTGRAVGPGPDRYTECQRSTVTSPEGSGA